MFGGKVVSFEDFEKERPKLGKIVAVSGGFDPIHPGHISYIQEAKKLGDILVVIVNGDAFLSAKKGIPFQNLETRSLIVSAVSGVDYVVPFEIEDDMTVSVALARLRPHIFANGGDREDASTIPEWDTCIKHGIQLIQKVGLDKRWSSSEFLKNWIDNHSRQT